jgi:transposase
LVISLAESWPVYEWDALVLLKDYLDRGLSKAAIARQLGVSREVIHHWIRTGQLDRDLSAPSGRRRPALRPTKLDAFHALIGERLATYPELSAVRLIEECRAAGYVGGYSQLKAYVARVRPRAEPEPVVRFETAPGLQAQFDFAEVRLPWGKRFALLVVLGYSRLLFVEFVARQTALTVMLGLERAFAAFGGVPHEILFDQMKSVLVADHRPGGGRLLENPEFLRFTAHWDFRIRACRPYTAPRRRARSSGRWAICAATSSTAARSWPATAGSSRRPSDGRAHVARSAAGAARRSQDARRARSPGRHPAAL